MKRRTAPRGTGKRRRIRRKPHKERAGNAVNVGGTDDGRIPNWIRTQFERAKAARKVSQ